MSKHIVVIGSSNTDMVIHLDRLPKPGQTLLGDHFEVHPGGKGANQAVAAARLGGKVVFIAAVGSDHFGKQAITNFKQDQIDTTHIKICDQIASGVALIMVNDQGENMIGVASGANFKLLPQDVPADVFKQASCLLMQLETPLSTIEHAARLAKENHVPVVLNPAPAQVLPDNVLSYIDIITPNETEAETLTGVKVIDSSTAKQAADILRNKGIKTVLITLGEAGVFISSEHIEAQPIPAVSVKAVDTTAAGDTFNGALCAALSNNLALIDAVHYANKAAAISVTKPGAQPAIPYAKSLDG